MPPSALYLERPLCAGLTAGVGDRFVDFNIADGLPIE
jgi:hypothetical protein